MSWWIALLAVAVGALVWRHLTVLFFSWTDEQIHFYVAHRLAQGAVLYRDIDSARPPLVLLPLEWLIKIGCSPLVAGRALVLGTQIATAGLLFWGGDRLASRRVGLLAALLFLSSPEVFARVHYTGIHLAAFSVTACVLFALMERPLLAGLCFGLTVAADQHGLVVCGVVAALTVARRPRDAGPFAAGAFIIPAVVFGGVWIAGGRHLWRSLVGIHLFHLRLGQGVAGQFWSSFTPWLYEHLYLLAGAGLAVALLRPSSRVVRVLLLVIGVHVAVVLLMKESVFLYVAVIAPLVTLLAAIGFDAAVARWPWRRARPRLMVAALATLALTAGGWAAARSYREGLDQRPYAFLPHLLHGEVMRAQQLDVARWVDRESMLPGSGTIFGDPTIVSVLALRSGLRVSGELADLNPVWVEGGSVSPAEIVSRIERDGVAAVISPPFGLVNDPYFKSYLFACYSKPRPFFPPETGPGSGLPSFIMVFDHLQGRIPCSP
ncbi:MAG TPA: hypothetical protein VKQ32_23270 [Polyangia bacterium]|nr:hypothetical protein [Polyangia bacterium]